MCRGRRPPKQPPSAQDELDFDGFGLERLRRKRWVPS